MAAGRATVVPASWLVKEVTVVASLGYLHHEFVHAARLAVDGRVRLGPLLDSTITLDTLPATIAELAADPGRAVKVLVDPRAG